LGKAGDNVSNEFIIQALREQRLDDLISSEEEKDNLERLQASRVWIVDPLDGTREYGEAQTHWAVHIALSVDGRPPIGAVALPGLGVTLVSEPRTLPAVAAKPRMVISRTRPAAEALAVAKALGAELVPMGSASAPRLWPCRAASSDTCTPVANMNGIIARRQP
jgi:3'(2'), 5'-bisphosphate nucleotidase